MSFIGPYPYGTDGGTDGPGDTSGSITVYGCGEGANWFLTTNDVFTVRSLTTITEIIRVLPASGTGWIPVGGGLIPMGSIILNKNGMPIDSAMQTLDVNDSFGATSSPAGTGLLTLAFQSGGVFGSSLFPARSDHGHAQADITNLVADLAAKQPLATLLTTLSGGDITPLIVPFFESTAVDATNANTAANVTSLTVSVTLPSGVWTVWAAAIISYDHSAAGSSRVTVRIDGTEDANGNLLGGSSGVVTGAHMSSKTGIGAGAIDVMARFRPGLAGTMTAQSSHVFGVAIRTD